MSKKLKLTTHKSPAITITRSAIKAEKLVYVAIANRKIRYRYGKSRIAYIGTTKTGASRIARSAAKKANDLLALHGIDSLEFYVVVSAAVQGLKTWRLLERALLLRFRERFGEPPKGNTQGKKMKWKDELIYLTYEKLDKVLDAYS